MAIQPTEREVTSAMRHGEDFFDTQARLQRDLDEAARRSATLAPSAPAVDAGPWPVKPTGEMINQRMAATGLKFADAESDLKSEMLADAKRLAAASAPDTTAEISAAFQAAESAREKAESILAEHQTALDEIKSGILLLANVRRKIKAVSTLHLDDAGAKALARTALNFFVDRQVSGPSAQNVSGFREFSQDLVFRTALQSHIGEFVKPLEAQSAGLVGEIKTEATANKINLKKAFAVVTAEQPAGTLEPSLLELLLA
jgi:hypothetical protein